MGQWLAQNELDEFVSLFAENHISGKELATLESDDLREMGVTSIGHRKKIMAAMAEFRTANTRIKRIAIEVIR